MLTIYDAARCPFCARARIVLAEKGVEVENVQIDLANRPSWLYDKNPSGKVPVLEEDGFVLPESVVIMEYLEERYPDPPLLPADPGDRALVWLWIERFDELLGADYYRVRRGDEDGRERLDARLRSLDAVLEGTPFLAGFEYTLADVAYVPWIFRGREFYGLELDAFPSIVDWVDRLSERPAIAHELDVVAALPR